MHSAIIAAEAVCLCMLTVVLYVMLFESHWRTNRDRSFLCCFVTVYVGTACDMLSYWLENAGASLAVQYVVNYVSVIAGSWMGLGFLVYLVFCIEEKQPVPRWFTWGPYIAVCVATLAGIVFTISGQLFFFTDGHFTEGSLYFLNVAFQLALPVYDFVLTICYRAALSGHDRRAVYTYLFLTVSVSTVSQFLDDLALGYVAASVSCLIIYLLMQTSRMRDAAVRESALTELSNTDTLTGLGNRRAAESALARADGDDGIGVAFFDVNGLKYVNDTQGHAAGDARLIRFGELLGSCFRRNEIFHIFGDEFMLVTGHIPRSEFESRMAQCRRLIEAEDCIASAGSMYGPGHDAQALVDEAETLMYADKERCHALHPEWNRK